MDETILTEILNTLKDFRAEQEERWEKNEHHWVQNEKRWEENERRWAQNEKRWEENERRWAQNEKRWEENERRWAENKKLWEENERRWAQNEKRWEENERRWTENDIDKFNLKKEFQRFIEIVDQNFASLSKKLDDFIKYSNTIHNKLELRLKKIETNQRYFEKVQESHQETIDIQNVRIDKLSSKI